jgi:hypothetical protein
MPLTAPGDFGTEADGSPCATFCRFCYQAGAFTAPHLSMEDMIEKLVAFAPHMNMTPEQAREMAEETLPRLKRWESD